MLTVSGGDSPYTVDSGEFQVALAEWGTVHHTGYPLYMLAGSPFVAALRALGVPPAAGAAAYSLVWGALAAGVTALLLLRLTGRPWLAGALALAFALTRSAWMHGAIPEVYSLSLLITAALLWTALDLLERPDARKARLLALLAGVGVAHHRLIAVALPAVGAALALTPHPQPLSPLPTGEPRKRGASRGRGVTAQGRGVKVSPARWLAVALLLFALGFLPYLDMPLRALRGATWVYGRPDTWQGFWFLFFGTEVEGWQRPALEAGVLLENARAVLGILAGELTWPGLLLAAAASGLALGRRETRRAAALLAGVAASYIVFTVFVYRAVLPEANLMTASLCLVLGLGLGLKDYLPPRHKEHKGFSNASRITNYRLRITDYGLRITFYVLLLALPLALFVINRPRVLAVARDPAGVDYIRKVSRLDAPGRPVVMAPWGWRYFALAYAQRVEGRFAGWQIVDHRADFAALAGAGGAAYTAADSFYIFTAEDFWRPRLGGAYLSSAGPGLVRVARAPEMRPTNAPVIPLGDGLGLMRVEVRPLEGANEWDVVVWWTATARPGRDYSTFVHVSDVLEIAAPADLIAQSDQAAPVYAWYATSRWSPGEVVREDHAVTLPAGRPAQLIVVGMYWQDEAGNFNNLGSVKVRGNGGRWEIAE
jgi:hypothetical protein